MPTSAAFIGSVTDTGFFHDKTALSELILRKFVDHGVYRIFLNCSCVGGDHACGVGG